MPDAAPERLTVSRGAEELPARLFAPPQPAPGPGLVLIQEIFGVTDYIASRAADLAALGYRVLVPEFYFRLGETSVEGTGEGVLERGMALAQRIDWEQTVGDAAAAFDALRHRPEVTGAGVIGFCWGGGLAFNLAAVRDPDVLVSYYGSALPDLLHLAPEVTAPSLHHFGLADSYLGPEVQERIRAAIARPGVTIETYQGAEHAFDGPMPGLHDERASVVAWRTTTAFLAAQLPVPGRG